MIYNGPSIYNQGGGGSGGGAYSDGGALVDGNLIQVTNNTISTYENTSRNEINYYFEVAENEIINAVIELTNQVNATVNIYVVKDGLYVPLGNVGGNTVTAGEDYKIEINGNSFNIEQVTLGAGSMLDVFGFLVPTIKINDLLWTTENLYSLFTGLTIGGDYSNDSPMAWYPNDDPVTYGHNGNKYNLLYNPKASEYINAEVGNGWRIPRKEDYQSLFTYIGGNTGESIKKIISWGSGTNTTGLSILPNGNYEGSFMNVGIAANLRYYTAANGYNGMMGILAGQPASLTDNIGRGCAVRLCKDI